MLHCIWALFLIPTGPASAQELGYTVFLAGKPAGHENVTVETTPAGTRVSAQGRSTPLNAVLRRAEFTYSRDWTPEGLVVEATIGGAEHVLRTSFKERTAVSEGTQAGMPFAITHAVSPQPVLLHNLAFAGYAALAKRLVDVAAGTELRAYVVPAAEFALRVAAVQPQRMQVGTETFEVRRYDLVLSSPGGDVALALTAAQDGTLIRLSVPAQALDFVRNDIASSTARTQMYSNPGDEAVMIPAAGFNLGATLTRPASQASRLPAVVLLAGSGVDDRDGLALGVPTLAQLAGALAEAGFLAVRYDKRGFGQSGGRAESATLSDYAEDVRAVVRWLGDRRDVDSKRIAVVGHSEGAWVALLAASRERRIAAVAAIAAPATTGAELILEQQRNALAAAGISDAERKAKVALQEQIHAAVLTGKGWESLPPELRRQADTPWFQSLLAYDPAKIVEDVRQPLLIVHGEIDRQVPVAHADRLAALARAEGRSRAIDVVIVRGVNHLLVPAVTGDVSEYGTLTDRNVSADVKSAINGWLQTTFASIN